MADNDIESPPTKRPRTKHMPSEMTGRNPPAVVTSAPRGVLPYPPPPYIPPLHEPSRHAWTHRYNMHDMPVRSYTQQPYAEPNPPGMMLLFASHRHPPPHGHGVVPGNTYHASSYAMHPPPVYYNQGPLSLASYHPSPYPGHTTTLPPLGYPGYTQTPIGRGQPPIQSQTALPSKAAKRIRPDLPIRDIAAWIRIQQLQQIQRNLRNDPTSDPKSGLVLVLYTDMHHSWCALDHTIQYEAVAEGALHADHWPVFAQCLNDHDPLNLPNIKVALSCLKGLCITQKQRNHIRDEVMLQSLSTLLPWAASRDALAFESRVNLLRVLVALLEDPLWTDRVALSTDLRAALAENTSRLWLACPKDDTVVQLARRILVAINPHCESNDDDDENAEEEEETCTEENCTSFQGTPSVVEEGNDDPAAFTEKKDHAPRPDSRKSSTLALTEDMEYPLFQGNRCAYFPHCSREAKDCRGWKLGSCTLVSLTREQETELLEWQNGKRQERKRVFPKQSQSLPFSWPKKPKNSHIDGKGTKDMSSKEDVENFAIIKNT